MLEVKPEPISPTKQHNGSSEMNGYSEKKHKDKHKDKKHKHHKKDRVS